MSTSVNRRAEVYLRTYTPTSEPQNRIITAVESLTAGGLFDEYDVEHVPRAVRRDDEPSEVERRYDAFQAWAARYGYDVGRPFEVVHHENTITGEVVDKLVLPIVSLAVYEDGALVAVLPCEAGGDHVSVTDYLVALQQGDDLLGTLTGPETEPVALR